MAGDDWPHIILDLLVFRGGIAAAAAHEAEQPAGEQAVPRAVALLLLMLLLRLLVLLALQALHEEMEIKACPGAGPDLESAHGTDN